MDQPDKEQITDHRAQSSVIGTILLVAIVVIVASVIGIFAIDIYQQTEVDTAPNADFDAEQYGDEDQQVRLFHNTGDSLNADEISVIVDDGNDRETFEGSNFPNDEIGSQDSVYIGTDSNDDLAVFPEADDPDGPLDAGTEINVIWDSPDADTSATLFEYEVEDR